MKLTKRAIDALSASEREVVVWDGEMKGFGVRVQPSGVKAFVLQYRNAGGRSRRVTLGRCNVLTVDEARKMARAALVDVAQGRDPADDRAAKRSAPTMSDLFDRYLSDHVALHNAERTARQAEDIVNRRLRPAIGARKVAEVMRADVERLHRSFAGTPRAANLALAILSKALSCAMVWGMRPEGVNPCKGVKRYRENARERFLSVAELGRLGETLALAAYPGLPWVVDMSNPKAKHAARNQVTPIEPRVVEVVIALALTGCRLSEVLELQWRDVDLGQGALALPSVKGGPRQVHPISAAAVEHFRGIDVEAGSPWVFPRRHDPARHLSKEVVENGWSRVRHHAGLADVRLHDLRHTVGTVASSEGGNAFAVRDLLRHKTLAMTSRYVNRSDDPVRALADRVGETISAGLGRRHRKASEKEEVETRKD